MTEMKKKKIHFMPKFEVGEHLDKDSDQAVKKIDASEMRQG